MQRKMAGFTIIEMIVVIVITSVLAGAIVQFILFPIETFKKTTSRAALVDIAETAIQRLAYDIHNALPNSVRVGCVSAGKSKCVEFLNIAAAGRYRKYAETAGGAGDILIGDDADADITNDLTFDVLGPVLNFNVGSYTAGDDCQDFSDDVRCLFINPVRDTGSSDWKSDYLRTLNSYDNTTNKLEFSGTVFTEHSPMQRFYIVDTPVKFVCNSAVETLTRYDNYDIELAEINSQLNNLGSARDSLLANKVADCNFTYTETSLDADRGNGLLTVELTLQDGTETVSLSQQISVLNRP